VNNTGNKKGSYEIKGILKRKMESAACLKYSVLTFVKKNI
jgi:hypothetical protein